MLQEDNSDTFEIIDKQRPEDMSESMSSVASSASLLQPSSSAGSTSGSLLANVAPPSSLPNFVTTTAAVVPRPATVTVPATASVPAGIERPKPSGSPGNLPFPSGTTMTSSAHQPHAKTGAPHINTIPAYQLPPSALPSALNPIQSGQPMQPAMPPPLAPTAEPFYPRQFTAAIPPSKGLPGGSSNLIVTSPAAEVVPDDIGGISDSAESGGGFMGWMKGAVGSGGLLSRVAEKAKNSMDSMITTLDPQMREFIYTGGDLEIVVASAQEAKISAIREAFQTVFGKAVVNGVEAKTENIAVQPVGFAAGVKGAEERIQAVHSSDQMRNAPVVAIENFILEIGEEKWYDLGVLILHDPVRQLHLQVFTQMTPVPAEIVQLAQEDTPSDYPLKWSGLSVPIGSLMANNLNVHHTEWHQALTGITRRDIILLAAKSLAALYKKSFSN